MSEKPLGRKAYGSIPHLPGSKKGPTDKGLDEKQASYLTQQTRDKHDTVIVQEKLDGSNVSVANIEGEVVALVRAGYTASSSPFPMHHHFAAWVKQNEERFRRILTPGERICGEWMLVAHATKYKLPHEPFVAFDIFTVDNKRKPYEVLKSQCDIGEFITPNLIHIGGAFRIDDAVQALKDGGGHGAIDPPEGAVWRMERWGEVDFMGKYVRHDLQPGKYLPGIGEGVTEETFNEVITNA